MKNNSKILKKLCAILILLATTISFAQPPEFDSPGTTGANNVQDATPIDSYVWVLILVGLGYVFYKYRKLRSYNRL